MDMIVLVHYVEIIDSNQNHQNQHFVMQQYIHPTKFNADYGMFARNCLGNA